MKIEIPGILFLSLMLIFTSCSNPDNLTNKNILSNNNTNSVQKKDTSNNNRIFNSLNKNEILRKLFDNADTDNLGFTVWKPNYCESIKNNISYDGNCHTSLDTIMYFRDAGTKRACVIFGTYKVWQNDSSKLKYGAGIDCHFCGAQIGIALFSQTKDDRWELYFFEKSFTSLGLFGTWKIDNGFGGGRSHIDVVYLGGNFPCLELKGGLGGNEGIQEGYSTIYSLVEIPVKGYPVLLSKIFEYEYYGEYRENGRNSKIIAKKTNMQLIKNNTEFFQINLIINDNNKISTEEYVYSEKYRIYLKTK